MRGVLLAFVIYLVLIAGSLATPIWKVFCTTEPLYRGRADPIVDPGILAQHSHKVWGGNNFGIGDASTAALDYYDHIRESSCTTCSITADLTNYWIPDLYYQWPNGSLSLVPNGGLTVYYLSRSGTAAANQSNPDFQPFPAGLRMTSGSPVRRNYNDSVIANQAISYACLGGTNGNETPYFPTNETTCPDGLRAQVWFPMCWDGVNLDSSNHQSHMSFPLQAPDGGDCPSSHPVRIPGVFFEVLFDVNPTTYPNQGNGHNPFVWSCGDSTGYGLHGDFLSGWPVDLVKAALADPSCDLSLNPNLAYGNNVSACAPMAPYVKANNPNGACLLNEKILTYEDLGVGHVIDHLPGCNPITHGPNNVVACTNASTPVTLTPGISRVLLKSALNDLYVTSWSSNYGLAANVSADDLGYSEVFVVYQTSSGSIILSEGTTLFVTAVSSGSTSLFASQNGASTWETYNISTNDDGTVSILAFSNYKYVQVLSDNTLRNNAVNVSSTAQKFYLVTADNQTQSTTPPQTIPTTIESSQPRSFYVGIVLAFLGLFVALL